MKLYNIVAPVGKTNTPIGKLVGVLADNTVAGALDMANVYMLSATGKDRAIPKRVALSAFSWIVLYGILPSLGVTQPRKVKPSKR